MRLADDPPSMAERAAYAEAEPRPFWLAELAAPGAGARPGRHHRRDLCIVGGGFTGLWAALHAKAGDPGRDVVVLEGETCGFGASGRNGGFANASLTHGLENGLARFADELVELERLGLENLEGLVADLARLGIDCELERTGDLSVLLHPALVERARRDGCAPPALRPRRLGARRRRDARRGRVADLPRRPAASARARRSSTRASSPSACGAVRSTPGVRLFEHTTATDLRDGPSGVELIDATGPRAGAAGDPRDQRLPSPAPVGAPLHRSRLRLRAGERAARPYAARRDRLAADARASATGRTSSTTTA